jgi:LuxR family transcriptional regulator, maltose regulon positive regulatory protein
MPVTAQARTGTTRAGPPEDPFAMPGPIRAAARGEAEPLTATTLTWGPTDAGRALERALDAAEPDLMLLPFLIHPAPGLLERHARQHAAHAPLIAEILGLLAGETPASPAAGLSSAGPRPLLEPLSKSELRVLRYLPSHLSAPEIANELRVSANTVKTHLRHLYAKLGAHRRDEVVDRARALGLLPAPPHSPSGKPANC